MKKYLKILLLVITISLVTGCGKLYSYEDVVNKTKYKIADDLIIEDPGNVNRDNGLQAYTAYLERDKYKKITIINGKDYLLPIAQNYLCTDFAEVYLVPKFTEFKNKNRYYELYNMKVESINSSLHPKCKNLKITIDCNDKEKYMNIIQKYKEYLKEDKIYLNETGINRYEISCENGQNYNLN